MTTKNSMLVLSLHKKWKFSIKNFLSKCDQIRKKLRIRSHLLKKSLMENFIFLQYMLHVFHQWDLFQIWKEWVILFEVFT